MAVINSYDKQNNPLTQGSGFFITSEGILVTNYHVVKGAEITRITAKLPTTGAIYEAKSIIGGDPIKDFVFLQFDAHETPHVKLGNSNEIRTGEKVVAIGAPLGLENSMSEGVISNPERDIAGRKYIQFTAPISSGSSGGGLFDRYGTVIGVTAAYVSGTPAEPGQNLNLAVPINLVRDNLNGSDTSLTTNSALYFYSLGQLADNRHQAAKALAYYNKALQRDASFADAYIGIGGIAYDQGDFKAEITNYEKAVQLDPNNYQDIDLLGTAYEDDGRYPDAITAYKVAIKLKPDDKDSQFQLALLSIMAGDADTARQTLPSLMQLDSGLGREIEMLLSRIGSH